MKHDAGLPFPLGLYVHRGRNSVFGWEWPVIKINEVGHSDSMPEVPGCP